MNPYSSTNYRFYPMFTGSALHRSCLNQLMFIRLSRLKGYSGWGATVREGAFIEEIPYFVPS